MPLVNKKIAPNKITKKRIGLKKNILLFLSTNQKVCISSTIGYGLFYNLFVFNKGYCLCISFIDNGADNLNTY